MIDQFDEETLRRITGLENIPEDLLAEYNIWRKMYHSAGSSGSLGSIGCIGAARSLGYGPKVVEKVEEKVSWRDYPHDGSTRVEAHFFGSWQPGVYLGFVDSGMLAIRLDDDDNVKECLPHVVRLAESDEAPAASTISEEGDEFLIDLTEGDEHESAEAGEVGDPKTSEVASSGS